MAPPIAYKYKLNTKILLDFCGFWRSSESDYDTFDFITKSKVESFNKQNFQYEKKTLENRKCVTLLKRIYRNNNYASDDVQMYNEV